MLTIFHVFVTFTCAYVRYHLLFDIHCHRGFIIPTCGHQALIYPYHYHFNHAVGTKIQVICSPAVLGTLLHHAFRYPSQPAIATLKYEVNTDSDVKHDDSWFEHKVSGRLTISISPIHGTRGLDFSTDSLDASASPLSEIVKSALAIVGWILRHSITPALSGALLDHQGAYGVPDISQTWNCSLTTSGSEWVGFYHVLF